LLLDLGGPSEGNVRGRFSLPSGGGVALTSVSDVSNSLSGSVSPSSSRFGRRVPLHISLCQSGVSLGLLCGEDGGVEEGESGISCQLSSTVFWFLLVERELGGAEFHVLVRFLLRIDSEELSPLVASFSKYEVSLVLSLKVHRWRFRSYKPIGISCRQWPLVVRLDVTLVTMHVVSPSLSRMGHHLIPQPSSSALVLKHVQHCADVQSYARSVDGGR
jgi:hypothetical protein